MAYKMFSEEKLSQEGQKNNKVLEYSFYSDIQTVLNIKKCINKLPIKMFMNIKERTVLTECL